jgi:uncharacterized DUF497 family protein
MRGLLLVLLAALAAPAHAAAAEAKKPTVVFFRTAVCERIHDDPDHSEREWREIIVGTSTADRLLLVCFTERNDIIRLINAREPDRAERSDYEEIL